MKEIFTKATISDVKVENVDGIYHRTLTAEIDGANGIVWLTDHHTNTVKSIDETRSMALTANQLKALQLVMRRIESEV